MVVFQWMFSEGVGCSFGSYARASIINELLDAKGSNCLLPHGEGKPFGALVRQP